MMLSRTFGAALGLLLAVAPLAAAAQTPPEVPTVAQPRANVSDVWLAIKEGKRGTVAGPAVVDTLIKPAVPGCTERAVGFTTPIHVAFPTVEERRGEGPTLEAMALLIGVFGFCVGAGAMLARNLGRHGA